MIRHVLLLASDTRATPDAIEACEKALLGLVGQVPGLLSCHFGENFAAKERTDGYTHGFTMDFSDRAALEAYGPHPAHKPVAKLVRETFARIAVLDFEL